MRTLGATVFSAPASIGMAIPALLLGVGCGSSADIADLPVADAGFDHRGVAVGAPVTLNGSASSDPGGASLTYAWSIDAAPTGSTAVVATGSDPSRPSFTPDQAGSFVISLVVSNEQRDSRPDVVLVEARNELPIAIAECETISQTPTCRVPHGGTADLIGQRSSDPEGSTLSYTWTPITDPADCSAACPALAACAPTGVAPLSLTGDSTVRATAVFPDTVGAVIVFQLTVSDGVDSGSDCVSYTTTNQAPAVFASNPSVIGTPQEGSSFSLSVIVDDADGDLLDLQWTQTLPDPSTGPVALLGTASDTGVSPQTVQTTTVTVPTGSITGQGTMDFSFRLTVDDGFATGFLDVPVTVDNSPP